MLYNLSTQDIHLSYLSWLNGAQKNPETSKFKFLLVLVNWERVAEAGLYHVVSCLIHRAAQGGPAVAGWKTGELGSMSWKYRSHTEIKEQIRPWC